MNEQYRAFHFCPRPDGSGLTITRYPVNITLRDAIRQLTPNVHGIYFGFCFFPNDVKDYIKPGTVRECTWEQFVQFPLRYGAFLTRSGISNWTLPGYPNSVDALPHGRP